VETQYITDSVRKDLVKAPIVETQTITDSGSWTLKRSFLTGWSFRKPHIINPATGAGTNYQVKVTVHYGSGTDSGADVYLNGKCRTDFGDVRFTDDDGVTLLDYWMETYTASSQAVFWIKVADDLSTNPATVYLYYGKPDAVTTSNAANTFIFFDNFETDLGWSYYETRSLFSGGYATDQYHSPTHSYSLYFPPNSVAYPNDYCEISKTLTLPEGHKKISLYTRDNRPNGGVTGYWYKQIYLGSNLLWNMDVMADAGNVWLPTEVETDLSGSQTLRLRLFLNIDIDNYTVTVWWDDVIIRKYVSPEPSHGAWGSEETPESSGTI